MPGQYHTKRGKKTKRGGGRKKKKTGRRRKKGGSLWGNISKGLVN